ncbi:amino acid permease [Bacillus dakarensis]|uniref:amino acid permease n=1 Tax=Robertmurraya dakarensis TaxID=1926278 RepID=UPI000980B26D|nr:amino acid permease [Bacillus dakarensis]
MSAEKTENGGSIQWWQLSLIGVGCIIGTGFFLGSAIAIEMTGPSVVIVFLLAAIGTYIVYDSLGRMSAKDPQKGSFRSYAKKAYGPSLGFTSGWVYWVSEMLIIGSQLTALSIFTKFWFDNIPLWVLSTIYAVLGIIVVLLGSKGFEKIENLLGVIKISAILMFIIIALLAIFGIVDGDKGFKAVPGSLNEFMPNGVMGLWAALIFGFYAFGGIEIMGIMATRLKSKDDAPKAGKVMLIVLTTIYIVSLGIAVTMISWKEFTDKKSPFVSALHEYNNLAFVPHVFNAALIIAGFSTMAASLFAVTSMLVTMSEENDAPAVFARKGKLKVPTLALGLTVSGLVVSIIMALLMPGRIYEYITTAAGLMLLYNWLVVLVSAPKLLDFTRFDHFKRVIGMILIALAVSGTLLEKASRPGLFVSLAFVFVILAASTILYFLRKKKKKELRGRHSNMLRVHRLHRR